MPETEDPSGTAPVSTRAPRPADTGPPTTLILVRHGRTAMTEQHRMAGGGGRFDPPLSELGRGDADRARAYLDLIAGGGVHGVVAPSVVLSSPMARTRETAQIAAAGLGLPVGIEPGFVENDYGHWDGLTYPEISERWPEEMRAWQGSPDYAPPGGESLTAHVDRVLRARDDVLRRYPGRCVLVVSHVTPIRALVRAAMDAGVAAMWRMAVDPCSFSITRHWGDGGAEVTCLNRT